jgi:hypothetical protein
MQHCRCKAGRYSPLHLALVDLGTDLQRKARARCAASCFRPGRLWPAIAVAGCNAASVCTDVEATNAPIQALLQTEHARASQLIEAHRDDLLALVDELLAQGQVTPARFAAITGLKLDQVEDALDPCAERLTQFRAAGHERRRA